MGLLGSEAGSARSAYAPSRCARQAWVSDLNAGVQAAKSKQQCEAQQVRTWPDPCLSTAVPCDRAQPAALRSFAPAAPFQTPMWIAVRRTRAPTAQSQASFPPACRARQNVRRCWVFPLPMSGSAAGSVVHCTSKVTSHHSRAQRQQITTVTRLKTRLSLHSDDACESGSYVYPGVQDIILSTDVLQSKLVPVPLHGTTQLSCNQSRITALAFVFSVASRLVTPDWCCHATG